MQELRIALMGAGFMGRAHSFGYRVLPVVFKPPINYRMSVMCSAYDNERDLAARYGWNEWTTDWKSVVNSPNIDVIDICLPGHLHHDVAVAAARAGKYVLCEKPLANNLAESIEMEAAVRSAGVTNMVAFCMRQLPAVCLAKELIAEGRLGEIWQWRGSWLSDWLTDPNVPLTWRLQKELAGSGALGDIGAHIVDLALHLVGGITEVVGVAKTCIAERPLIDPGQAKQTVAVKNATQTGRVTVDDAATWLAQFDNGATGVFEVSRVAGGDKELSTFEINGSKGSIRYDYRIMNELQFLSLDDHRRTQGYRTIVVGDGDYHKFMSNWWVNGHLIGYEALFVHQIYELLSAVAEGRPATPSFADGVACQRVVEAVTLSLQQRQWVRTDAVLSD
jgi:predicted dehydrogenase